MATANELRELKTDELASRITDLKQSIFEMRSKHNTGVLDSTADLMKAKRDIARCYTLVREQELGKAHPVKTEAATKAKEVKAKSTADEGEATPKKKPAAKKSKSKKEEKE